MFDFGDKNALMFTSPRGEILMLGREFTEDHKAEILYFTDYSGEIPHVLSVQWISKKKPKSHCPKHTGGKPEYAKVYLKELENLGLDKRELGSALALLKYIDWKSGILIQKRPKKPLDFNGLMKVLDCSRMTLHRRLKRFREAGLLSNDEEGHYLVSRQFVQKG